MNRPTFPRRAHSGGSVMTAAEFWTLAQIMRIHLPNREAARRVLVDGITQIRAGEETGLSRQSVGNTVKRMLGAYNWVYAAFVTPRFGPKS